MQAFGSHYCVDCRSQHGLAPGDDAAWIRAQEAAVELQEILQQQETRPSGQMFGVLVASSTRRSSDPMVVARAFAGKLDGEWQRDGWAPPIVDLEVLKRSHDGAQSEVVEFTRRLDAHRTAQADRVARLRWHLDALAVADGNTVHQARVERAERRLSGAALRDIQQRYASARSPIAGALDTALAPAKKLKSKRRAIARDAMLALQRQYKLTNARGTTRSMVNVHSAHDVARNVAHIFADGDRSPAAGHLAQSDITAGGPTGTTGRRPPSGTGDCCAPKLLQWAVKQGLQPKALLEFWWGPPPPGSGRQQGSFYAPCEEKCSGVLGFLLCGATP